MLDRCFLVNRYPLISGKELIVINTHNSAYDDGDLKLLQMEYLKDFLLEQYNQGHYIIVGGDWNQLPHDFNPGFKTHMDSSAMPPVLPRDYLPDDWSWVYDAQVPTNRSLNTTYIKNRSAQKIIDFYLVSPNIKAKQVKTINMEFENSDHQPVIADFRLQ